jgi:ATP-binding cassette subfamily F protein 3
VKEYREDLEGYERWILSTYRASQSSDARTRDNSRREKRQQAATQREKLRPLQTQLAQTETEMEAVARALQEVREQMASTELYTEAQRDTLAELLKREGVLKLRAAELDEIWLDQQQRLDDLSPP